MRLLSLYSLVMVLAGVQAAPQFLVSSDGDKATIPKWSLQSTERVSSDMALLSQPGLDVSPWHRVAARSTVMAGLIENDMYNDTELFFSDNMKQLVGNSSFQSPWVYREEFTLMPTDGQFFTLKTHGITSKADIYVNGALIASADKQQGSFGGHQYDLTDHLQDGTNCILIRAHPTNYLRDFAMGFVDWNPYPPDNGTGVWRDVEISQTGAVSMSPFRVISDFTKPSDKVMVSLRIDLINHSSKTVFTTINGTVVAPDGSDASLFQSTLTLRPREAKTAVIEVYINKPEIWWPASLGKQPLYTLEAVAVLDGKISDFSRPQEFGIRHVASHVNEHNDTVFSVNGHPFQVLGAGYSPDMFMRFDEARVEHIFDYMLDMGLNTVRLEGKQEHPEFYTLADRMGLMVLAGWECCDKWEGWEYNHDANGVKWGDSDYPIARAAMRHEAEMMQAHPSILGFLVGSDYWPDDHATEVFLKALREMDWNAPVIASASKRGYPEALGPSGMKMDGPYDWVPPNYWYGNKAGAAFGFGSELGAGVGTPEMGSLKKFMWDDDLETLWTEPDAGLYHMSNAESYFSNRKIYNKGLFSRYGSPKSLEDYVIKCQMADYEATRAQFEAYSARQNATRPATGAIYWMLNSAWPNLHWQLFDYYLSPMGAYFGTKVGTQLEHVAYDYETRNVWLINLSNDMKGQRQIEIDLIDAEGKKISSTRTRANTTPSSSKQIQPVSGIDEIEDVAFLRLVLRDGKKNLSRNVYWLSSKPDVLNWDESNWYYTPVTDYADFSKLESLPTATVKATVKNVKSGKGWTNAEVQLENKSKVPAVFVRVNVARPDGDVTPVFWSDNYVTLWPKEKMTLAVSFQTTDKYVFEVSGRNVESQIMKPRGK